MLIEPELPLGHFRLTFKAGESWRLPPFAGDMWRRALKSAAHALDRRDDRLGGSGRVAGYLFESAPGPWAEKMRRYPRVPHPLIIRPVDLGPHLVRAGEEVSVDVMLVGHGNRFLQALLEAADAAAQKGLGLAQSRGRAALRAVHRIDLHEAEVQPLSPGRLMAGPPEPQVPLLPPVRTEVTLHLITPLRVRRDGNYALDPARLDARSLLMTLVRRVSMLCYFHTEHPLETDFAALKAVALATGIDTRQLVLEPLQRPATQEHPPEAMDGLVGRLRLVFEDGNPFWPYLGLARWLGIGHGANVGLGMIDLEL